MPNEINLGFQSQVSSLPATEYTNDRNDVSSSNIDEYNKIYSSPTVKSPPSSSLPVCSSRSSSQPSTEINLAQILSSSSSTSSSEDDECHQTFFKKKKKDHSFPPMAPLSSPNSLSTVDAPSEAQVFIPRGCKSTSPWWRMCRVIRGDEKKDVIDGNRGVWCTVCKK